MDSWGEKTPAGSPPIRTELEDKSRMSSWGEGRGSCGVITCDLSDSSLMA